MKGTRGFSLSCNFRFVLMGSDFLSLSRFLSSFSDCRPC